VLRNQIPLGLNYGMTGCPNFNTDIGGFFCGSYNTRGGGSAPRNPQFQELYVRWMQYGLFCPVFRSHGTDCSREIWEFGKPGEAVYDAIAAQIRLRYRLLPYIYSTAWQVTSNNDTYMRPLFADFAADKRTWQEPSEFLFGRSILAAPIVQAQYTPEAVNRKGGKLDAQGLDGWSVSSTATTNEGYPVVDFSGTKSATKYLPKGTQWYDFWTGKEYRGGQDVTFETRLDRVPMFVRAGSILPLGPEMQYVGEKTWDALELRVYPGADATFTLYEDEGDNYNYEQGKYTTIQMQWNDSRRTLTIGNRQGNYDGMLTNRVFNVVLPDGTKQTVTYIGKEVTAKF
jgi:alpha-D-xyloside xylohydrolase